MADVFISYARADRDRVLPLVRLFEEQGWSVWWDRDLVPGSAYEQVIDDAISAARCVVVAWSRLSIGSEWVQAEAGDGLDRHVLVPVLFDDVRVPISFRRRHAARLLDWPGRHDQHEITHLLDAVRACIDGVPAVDAPHASAAAVPVVSPRSRRAWRAGAAIIAIACVAGLGYYASTFVTSTSVDATAAPVLESPAIAVLPFSGPDALPVEIQVGYEITERLGKYPTLRVLSDEAVGPSRENEDAAATGRRLAVDFVITGEVRTDKRTRQIGVSLISARSGRTLWTDSFAAGPDGLSTIANAVGPRVHQTLKLPGPTQDQPGTDVAHDAYLAYLRGRAALRQPNTNAAARAQAIRNFERAIAADSRFAPGFAGLCTAYLAEFKYTQETVAFENAEKNCHRALTLEDDSSAVAVALGGLYEASGHYERAMSYYERALNLAPYDADALRGMGRANQLMGLVGEAEEAFRTVIRIEPTYWENHRLLGGLYFMVGRYDKAAEQYRREADLNPDKASSLVNLGSAHFMAGDFDAAVADWSKSLELDADVGALSNLGAAQFFRGKFAEAAEIHERALAMSPNDHGLYGNAGEAHYFAGDDRYVDFYERAIELADRQLAINPDDFATLAAKGYYHAALGNAQAAELATRRAIELNGQDVYTWYDAARAFARLDRRKEAADAIRRALELGYSHHLVEADANFAEIVPVTLGEAE